MTRGVICLLLLAGCTRQVQLLTSGSSPGARYVCTEAGCTPSASVDPARSNRAGTKRIVLPPACSTGVHELLVARAEVEVTCAAREEPIGGMQ